MHVSLHTQTETHRSLLDPLAQTPNVALPLRIGTARQGLGRGSSGTSYHPRDRGHRTPHHHHAPRRLLRSSIPDCGYLLFAPLALRITALTPFPRRGFRRAPGRRRGTFRPPPWVTAAASGGSRGCSRTARDTARWPGGSRDKTADSHHVLSGWSIGRQKARKRHSQTLNIDLSLPDRDGELGLASIHKARGPDPAARDRRRRLVVEHEAAGEAQTNAGGAYVKMTFSSAARARSVVERSHTSMRSLRTPGYRPAPRPHHPSSSHGDRRQLVNR